MAALSLLVNQASVRTVISHTYCCLNSLAGKTCFLYYLLILHLLQSKPTVFQSMDESVFTITDQICKEGTLTGDDVIALIDVDGKHCKPSHQVLSNSRYQILLTSSLRTRIDRHWMKQYCPYTGQVLVMEPCSLEEVVLMAFVFPIIPLISHLTIHIGCSC